MKIIIVLISCMVIKSQAGIFDKPENLQILDKNISAEKLRDTMKGFAMSLGVRCSHCHVGEEGQPLTAFDFSSDKKQHKKTARLMMKMVKKLNKSYISKVQNNSLKVECMSCHRGQNKPQLTKNILIQEYHENGIESLLEKYQQLKKSFFGTHTHDFSEMMLLTVADEILEGDSKSAEKLYNKNLEVFPNGLQSIFTLARYYHNKNLLEKALKYYKMAQDLTSNPWLEKTIKELENK